MRINLLWVLVSGVALAACSSSTTVSGGSAGVDAGGSGGAVDAGKPCQQQSDCDDGNSCNGSETCSGGHCAKGTAPAEGTSCTPPPPDGGTASGTDGGATYKCVAQACAVTCTADSDCDDGDVCTGNEICNPTTKTCQTGTPPVCDDKSDCTTNECDPLKGCYFPLIDADGDDHADVKLGACGDDCDDSNKTIYVGAAELCDGKDNNCNGQIDENAPTWYADCDGDGFAPAGAQTQSGCAKPTTAPSACSGGTWTSQAPAAGTTDCWDKDAKAHPMTASENKTAWQTSAMSGNPPVSIDFDYNCDGSEEKELTHGHVLTTTSCAKSCNGTGFCYCNGAAGWSGPVPACGKSGTYSSCNFLVCTRLVTQSKLQPCR